MALREARSDDLPQMWRINQAEVPAVGSVTEAELGALLKASLIAVVAEQDDVVGGFCLVLGPESDYSSQNYRWFTQRYDDFIYLDRVAIAPEFQRRGIGHRMYTWVEHLALDRRPTASVFALEVNLVPRNDSSLAFHDQMGFREVGVRSPNPDYSVSMMVKDLPRQPPAEPVATTPG